MPARFTLLIPAFLFLLFPPALRAQSAARPKSDTSVIRLADPALFYDRGTYYLYGTVEGNSGSGFLVYTSPDLRSWNRSPDRGGYALKKGEAFGSTGFWAPQVFRTGGRYYMAYVANEQIAIAESGHPAGPFTQKNPVQLAAPVKQIDPYVFLDDDGKRYLYHVRLTEGNRIFVAELLDDLSGIKPETVRECVTATEKWENTASAPWPVAEGPAVLKRKGTYYLFYTANDFRNPDYAVGYATSTTPLGPWKKWEGNPILHGRSVGQYGTGHGDFITGRSNRLYYVLHTHDSGTKVGPRKTAVVRMQFRRGQFSVKKGSFRYLERQKG